MKHNPVFLTTWLLVILAILLSGCKEVNGKARMEPTHQMYFGLAVEGLPTETSQLRDMEKQTGLPVSMVNFFLQWPENPADTNFPGDTLKAIHEFGGLACLTWEPMYYDQSGREHMIPAQEILEGRYDGYIDHFAARIRELGYPVIIRFAHEMNLKRYHWGGDQSSYGPDSPERYREMFRYISERFRKAGADNALLAFCPNSESVPGPQDGADWNRAKNYYPGHKYVDVLGMDGYNWGETRTLEEHGWKSRWQTFEEIFSSIYKELREISSDKPIFVFETAASDRGGDRDLWVRRAFETAKQWDLQGIFWFQVDKETDWRLKAGPDQTYPGEVRRKIFSPLPHLHKEN